MKTLIKYSTLIFALIALAACSDDSNSTQTAGMSVRLVDAPGDYDNVFIDVETAVVKFNDNLEDNGAETEEEHSEDEYVLNVTPMVYDLLELTGGNYALLADEDIPAGNISQVRLVLGTENSVVIDGESFPLQTPSAQQSGLKVQFNQTLEAGKFYTVVLDFDVEKSIVMQGNGGYSLNPVIRASAVEATGMISGTILSSSDEVVPATVSTMVGDTEVTTATDSEGNFVLNGIPEGTYTLNIDAELTADVITSLSLEDIVVVNGETTAVGTVIVE